jgi:hypothetical protein
VIGQLKLTHDPKTKVLQTTTDTRRDKMENRFGQGWSVVVPLNNGTYNPKIKVSKQTSGIRRKKWQTGLKKDGQQH